MRLLDKKPGYRCSSPSQLKTAKSCLRLWGWTYIAGIRSPPTDSQRLGTVVHGVLEEWLSDGVVPDEDTPMAIDKGLRYPGRIAAAGLPFLPPPGTCEVEKRFWLETEPGVAFYGFIDFLSREQALVGDHKSTTDFKWALTPDDLLTDEQSIIYSVVGMLLMGVEQIDTRWVYYRNHGIPAARPVSRTRYWDEATLALASLTDIARYTLGLRDTCTDVMELPPNPGNCGAYGGCAHQERCKITNKERIRAAMGESETTFDIGTFVSNRAKEQTEAVAQASEPPPVPSQIAAANPPTVGAAPPPVPESKPEPEPAPPPLPEPEPEPEPEPAPPPLPEPETLPPPLPDPPAAKPPEEGAPPPSTAATPPETAASAAMPPEITASAATPPDTTGSAAKPPDTQTVPAPPKPEEGFLLQDITTWTREQLKAKLVALGVVPENCRWKQKRLLDTLQNTQEYGVPEEGEQPPPGVPPLPPKAPPPPTMPPHTPAIAVLYIDCAPVPAKNVYSLSTLLQPLLDQLNPEGDYRLHPDYGAGQAAGRLAQLVLESCEEWKGKSIIASTIYAEHLDVLPTLEANAKLVVRGV